VTIVVDASVMVGDLIDPDRRGVWARSQLTEGLLAAPHLVTVEATRALRRARLNQRLSADKANLAFADLLNLPLALYPLTPFAARIWELRETVTAYDAWYVALAETLGAPLVTLDRRLAKSPGPTCRFETPPSRI